VGLLRVFGAWRRYAHSRRRMKDHLARDRRIVREARRNNLVHSQIARIPGCKSELHVTPQTCKSHKPAVRGQVDGPSERIQERLERRTTVGVAKNSLLGLKHTKTT
jgi:hypothetical protein